MHLPPHRLIEMIAIRCQSVEQHVCSGIGDVWPGVRRGDGSDGGEQADPPTRVRLDVALGTVQVQEQGLKQL